jgi:hypothetical protein
MGTLHHYDPALVDVIAFLTRLSGFAEDSMVTVEESEDAFSLKAGVDGDFTRVKLLGRSALIVVSLMQTSKSNAFLSGVHNQDIATDGGAGVGAFLILDRNGASVFKAGDAWIERGAPPAYGKDVGPREWRIRGVNYKILETGT